jgi:hypothetical protein
MTNATNAGADRRRADALDRLTRIESLLRKALEECKDKLHPEPRSEVERKLLKATGSDRRPGLGGLVGIAIDTDFIRKWEYATSRDLDALKSINLFQLSVFRNAVLIDGRHVSVLEGRFVAICLEIVEDAFGFSTARREQ